jgi:hypothetical protein
MRNYKLSMSTENTTRRRHQCSENCAVFSCKRFGIELIYYGDFMRNPCGLWRQLEAAGRTGQRDQRDVVPASLPAIPKSRPCN